MQKKVESLFLVGSIVINMGLTYAMDESRLSCPKQTLKEFIESTIKLTQTKGSRRQEDNRDNATKNLDEEEEEKIVSEEVNNFLRLTEETSVEINRESFIRLPIVKYSNLLIDLTESSFTGEKECTQLDTSKSELEKRVYSRAPYYEITYPMSSYLNSGELKKKIELAQMQAIIENKLKMIKRPSFKVLSTWNLTEEVRFEQYYPDQISIVICYGDGNWKIIDLEKGKILFKGVAERVDFNAVCMKALVKYKNGRGEIRDLEGAQKNGKIIFKAKNIKRMCLSMDAAKVVIEYDNRVGEVLSLEGKGILFCEEAVVGIILGFTDKRVIVCYEDGAAEIRCIEESCENRKALYLADGVETVYLNKIRTKALFRYRDGKKEIIDLESGKVIFQKKSCSEEMVLNSAGTSVAIYGDSWIEIIDLESGKKVVEVRKNVDKIDLDSTNTKMILGYKNGVGKIIDLKNSEILLNENNVITIDAVDSRLAKIYYKDNNKAEIRSLENGNIFFRGYGIEWITSNATNIRAAILYKNGKGEIRDFQEKIDNGIIIFNGENIEKMNFDATGTKVVIWYKNKEIKVIDLKGCGEASS